MVRPASWILAGLIGTLTAQAVEPNLLENPSFERVEGRTGFGRPAAWQAWVYPGTVLHWDGSRSRSGSGSACIEVAPSGASQFPQFCQRIKVRPGEHYRARVWARTENVTSSWGPQLNLEFFDANEKRLPYVQGGQAGGGTREWTELNVEAYVPNDAAHLLFSAFLHREGKVWWDDAELIKVSEPEAFPGSDITIRVRPDQTLNPKFLGFGAHGDNLLALQVNAQRNVTEADRHLVRQRVAAMRPKLMRVFFDYKWWEPIKGEHSVTSESHQALLAWIQFLGSIDCDVILQPWGDYFAYSDWMRPGNVGWGTNAESRLPLPAERDSMVGSLADFIQYLHQEKGCRNVKYVGLMNEPENDPQRPTPAGEYLRLNALLARSLKERHLEQEVSLLGPDDCTAQHNGRSLWWRETVPKAISLFNGFSSHTYQHRDTRLLKSWIQDRMEQVKQLDPQGPSRPLLVTEFGYVGLQGGTFENPETESYEYGLFMGDFAIEILNSGASGALMWCLFDQYYDDANRQRQGLWEFKDRNWRPRPAFYSWSLICRETEAGSRVVPLEALPPAQNLRAAALISPQSKMTLMVVNRYDRTMSVTLHPGLEHEAVWQLYRYNQDAFKAATGTIFGPSAEFSVQAQGSFHLTMPAQSFALLRESSSQTESHSSLPPLPP